MAIVQSARVLGNAGLPASRTGTFTTPTTAGNCVVISVCAYGTTSTTYSVSSCKLGTTSLAQLVSAQAGVSGGNPFTAIWALPGCPGGITSFSVTVTGGNAGFGSTQGITAYEVSGLATTLAALVDQSSTGHNTTGTAVTSGTTPATSSPGDIVFGAASISAVVSAPTASFTNDSTNNIVTGYLVPGVTGSFSYGCTGSVSQRWAAVVVALSPPATTVVTPDTVTATAAVPVPAVWPITLTGLAATASVTGPAVSPAQIFHIGDGPPYTGSDYSAVVSYSSTTGTTLAAFITVYNTGNNPSTISGVFDDAGNTWTVAAGGCSYNAATGLYGYTAVACCVGAAAMNYITVYYSDMLNIDHADVQISEFAGIPAGSTPAGVTVSSPNAVTGSFTAPAVTVPDGAYLILSAVASSGTWSSATPGTLVDSTQGSWRVVTAAGSYAPAYSGVPQTVYGAVTVAIGFAAPAVTALFTPVGGWIGVNSGPLPASTHAAGNLMVVKVTNTSDNTVYCTGLTSGGATWTPAGTPFFGVVNAMTAAAFSGLVLVAGQDVIVPSWSGATPASWTMAGHEFSATHGWSFDTQGGLDSTGTSAWPSLTPSAPGGLYFGHATATSASAGSTAGYVYNINVGGSGSSAAYNPGTP